VFHDSHLPLWKWFLAIYLMVESKKGMSANQIKRTLGVSYKTAWYLCHRIRWAMGEVQPEQLSGTVEVDETYIGGKARGPNAWREKTMVLGAIERDGRVVFHVEGKVQADKKNLYRFVKRVVADGAEAIYTDQHSGYIGIGDENTRHESVSHSQEEWERGDVSTQSIEKCGVSSTAASWGRSTSSRPSTFRLTWTRSASGSTTGRTPTCSGTPSWPLSRARLSPTKT
jgi:hypothetical protein